jgi:hypothetical protein
MATKGDPNMYEVYNFKNVINSHIFIWTCVLILTVNTQCLFFP